MDSYAEGRLGEVRAEQALAKLGYDILARNYRCAGAEIVFVEVKMRGSARASSGREAVTPAKQRRICKGAMYYMMRHGLMNQQARFDVMEIQGTRIVHIRDAFPYQGPAY